MTSPRRSLAEAQSGILKMIHKISWFYRHLMALIYIYVYIYMYIYICVCVHISSCINHKPIQISTKVLRHCSAEYKLDINHVRSAARRGITKPEASRRMYKNVTCDVSIVYSCLFSQLNPYKLTQSKAALSQNLWHWLCTPEGNPCILSDYQLRRSGPSTPCIDSHPNKRL